MRERERGVGTAGVSTEVRADTDAGERQLVLTSRAGGRYMFRAAMGQPQHLQQETLDAAGESLVVATLGIGNPQCVALMPVLPDAARFQRLGPALATHPRFAAGTNVEFAVVEAPGRVRILIWERGVGPTEASGTGACAAAITAMAYGGAARDVDVVSPGGTQRVEWTADGVYLTGWAEILFDATWHR
jgi:diaminopimelate epimerase